MAHEGKISGWRVAYVSPRIKSNLEKKIVIPVAFIYDYWSHLFSVAQNISLVEIYWLLKKLSLTIYFPYSKWTRCWLTSIFDGSWMLCLWKDISEEICFPWKVRENYQSHSVKVKTWSLKGKQMLSKQVLDWFWLQGSSVRMNTESGDRSGTSGNTVGHSLQKRTWSLSGLCVQTWKSHLIKSTGNVTSKGWLNNNKVNYWGVRELYRI